MGLHPSQSILAMTPMLLIALELKNVFYGQKMRILDW
jgi:hypothetical protein